MSKLLNKFRWGVLYLVLASMLMSVIVSACGDNINGPQIQEEDPKTPDKTTGDKD